jgi:predicted GNAT family acetyltransferase
MLGQPPMSVISRVRGSLALRVLGAPDYADVMRLLAQDPAANVFVTSRVEHGSFDQVRLGGELWGHYSAGRLDALCYVGANLVPVADSNEALRCFADRARRQPRRCSSIVGPAHAAMEMWRLLEPAWGPARDVRAAQPLMVISGSSPTVAPNLRVRPVRPSELDVVLPACVAMFTEEVGISPNAEDGGVGYRARVAELVNGGRAFAWIENGQVIFKAEIGALTRQVCQVQGVWVNPEYRGQGLAAGGMAAVVEYALRDFAPVVSLYVNDFNAAARAVYRRVGFTETGMLASVLF